MRLTPHIVEATYTYLRQTPPFSSWKLPEADEVEFHVTGHHDRYADCGASENGAHCIRVSGNRVDHTLTLLPTMAHEMIHLRLEEQGVAHAGHGPAFRRMWRLVCKHHGFDPKAL